MSTIEFTPWPKIARLNRDIIVTEKIDGTNAAVVIIPFVESRHSLGVAKGTLIVHRREEALQGDIIALVGGDGEPGYAVFAQSRNRFITPNQDNYGFARWVKENAEALVETLGEGTHFGEWWGSGIQRGYGLKGGDKRFSLFNVKRWEGTDVDGAVPGLSVVPVLYRGPFDQYEIAERIVRLKAFGSDAAPGFASPEGIVVFHTASRESYKVTLEGDEAPKGAAAHANDEEKIAA